MTKRILSLFLATILVQMVIAQSSLDYTVMVDAVAEDNPLQITLNWNLNGTADNYYVFRKSPTDQVWGSQIATLSASDTSFVDTAVQEGVLYDYRVFTIGSDNAYGYVRSGIKVRLPSDRGGVLVVVESDLFPNLTDQLADLEMDLIGDGYQVALESISSDTSVAVVKSMIDSVNGSMLNLQSIYIIGHVPVPYSGNLAPDGHVPDHLGAWPADLYYADLNGNWTDAQINNSSASDSRNHNVPGDGKFDQSEIPSDIELMIGRIDFSNLTNFSESELELTRRYLDRVHAFKHQEWSLPKRGLVDDNFGGFSGEAFGSNGWRNFSPLVGRENVYSLDYRSTMSSNGYLFSYGCGAGSHVSANGIGTSVQFATDSLLTGFTMLFGSYFGDWDRENNLMRSALAQGRTMSISWAGRPWWYFHPMGMGASLGECARLTMNNVSTQFQASYGARFTHLALLGDPSLRMEYIASPSQLALDTVDTFDIALSWTASSDTGIDGYSIYHRLNGGVWEWSGEVDASNITAVVECVLDSGMHEFSLRAFKLVNSRSGSYYLESIGSSDSVHIKTSKYPVVTTYSYTQYMINHPEGLFQAQGSKYVTSYTWIPLENGVVPYDTLYGDSVESYEWYDVWEFEYLLIAENRCYSDTTFGEGIQYFGGIDDLSSQVSVYPNPVRSENFIQIVSEQFINLGEIRSMDGSLVYASSIKNGQFLIPKLSAGLYMLHLNGEIEVIKKLIILD